MLMGERRGNWERNTGIEGSDETMCWFMQSTVNLEIGKQKAVGVMLTGE